MRAILLANQLIDEEVSRRRINRADALERVAREAGLSPYTLQNLLRGRLKFVERITRPLDELLEKKLERRLAEVTTQLALARAQNDRAREADILGAAAAVEEAERLLGRR